MKTPLGTVVKVTGALLAVAPMTGSAQDYFREYGTSRSSGGIGPVTPGDYTYRDISPSGLQPVDPAEQASADVEHSNFAIGPVRFSMAVGLGVEFNDNITFSEDDRLSDIIIRPTANIEAIYRLSEMNTLRLSLGLSYAKYLDHSRFDTDSVLISPTSAIELTFMLGEVKITARDRFSYQEDAFDVPQISNVAQYGRYENQIGIQAEYNVNEQVRIAAGYDHYNLWTKESAFEDQDRSIDTVFFKPSYGITPTVRVGLNATYSFIAFDSGDRPDGNALFIGPTIEWQITENTSAYLEVGYQTLNYDGEFTPSRLLDSITDDLSDEQRDALRRGNTDSDDSSSWYVRAQIDSKPNEVFRHRLSFSKTAEIGFFSDYYDLYHVEYNAEYTGIQKTSVGPSVFYEYYESSGNFNEKASRVGAVLGIRHYLTNSITLGLDYRFTWKDSNIEGADYYQNLVFLSAYYKF